MKPYAACFIPLAVGMDVRSRGLPQLGLVVVFICLFVAPCVNFSLPRLALLMSMCFVADATPKSIFGRGLELLWASVQDDAPVTAEVADQVPYTVDYCTGFRLRARVSILASTISLSSSLV